MNMHSLRRAVSFLLTPVPCPVNSWCLVAGLRVMCFGVLSALAVVL